MRTLTAIRNENFPFNWTETVRVYDTFFNILLETLIAHCTSRKIIPAWAWGSMFIEWYSIESFRFFIYFSFHKWCFCSIMVARGVITIRSKCANCSVCSRTRICRKLSKYYKRRKKVNRSFNDYSYLRSLHVLGLIEYLRFLSLWVELYQPGPGRARSCG